ncbi:hypothetical protein [Streptomyces zaomyceticus]|uniref:hypothetical protein n=1 Tax=Streptomyces zaomyceticus TaxID=68286 RepID=UPI0033A147E2
MNPNSTPPEGLCARESAQDPERAPGAVGVTREAQAGVQRLQPSNSELHAQRAHPDWEYATTEGPRKHWDDIDVRPAGEDGEPDPTWQRNTDAGIDGWERFAYTEESYWRRPKPAAQTAVEEPAAPAPDPHAVILDAISTALNAASYWLPSDAKRAVADAVLKTRNDEAEKWRRQAVDRGLELGRLQRTLELVEAAARAWLDDHYGADCARAVLDALNAYPAKQQPSTTHPRARCRCDHARDLHDSTDCAGCTQAGRNHLAKHAFIAREDQP